MNKFKVNQMVALLNLDHKGISYYTGKIIDVLERTICIQWDHWKDSNSKSQHCDIFENPNRFHIMKD